MVRRGDKSIGWWFFLWCAIPSSPVYAMVSGNYGYANTYGTLLILLGLMIVVIQSVVLKLGSDDR